MNDKRKLDGQQARRWKLSLGVITAFAIGFASLPSGATTTADTAACEAWLKARSRRDLAAFHSPRPDLGCFDGSIALETIAPLLEWLPRAPTHSALVIRSPGGDVKAGLQLGRLVLETKIKVYALEQCASSCANYVFMLGREPQVLPDTLVLYHGGANREMIAEIPALVRAQLGTADPQIVDREIKKATAEAEQLLAEQRKLYTDAGVRTAFLERFGLISFDAIPAKDCTPEAASKPNGFVALSKQQYQQLGVQPSGDIVTDVERISALLERLGSKKVGICLAPAVLFE